MKKILFILNTYGFQSKVLDKKKTIEKNYQIFNTLDNSVFDLFKTDFESKIEEILLMS